MVILGAENALLKEEKMQSDVMAAQPTVHPTGPTASSDQPALGLSTVVTLVIKSPPGSVFQRTPAPGVPDTDHLNDGWNR